MYRRRRFRRQRRGYGQVSDYSRGLKRVRYSKPPIARLSLRPEVRMNQSLWEVYPGPIAGILPRAGEFDLTTVLPVHMTALQSGSSHNRRTGNQVLVRNIRINIVLRMVSADGLTDAHYRILVVQPDYMDVGVSPAGVFQVPPEINGNRGSILDHTADSADPTPFGDMSNILATYRPIKSVPTDESRLRKFRVLYDRIGHLHGFGTTRLEDVLTINIKKVGVIKYNSTNPEDARNGVYLYIFANKNQVAPPAGINATYQWTKWFMDTA